MYLFLMFAIQVSRDRSLLQEAQQDNERTPVKSEVSQFGSNAGTQGNQYLS
jgi:hypothetical protein